MSTKDISRFLFQPAKHYVGMRMQQGRVTLDSDHNEGAWHDDEDQRRTLLELIGPQGSPDGGFFIGYTTADGPTGTPQPITNGVNPGVTQVEFNNDGTDHPVPNYFVMPGSMYVGGLRVELEAPEHIAFQSDFLQNSPLLGDIPSDLSSSATVNHHFFFLNVWEQCVTAVEDEEILERALGGPDTSVRVRRMRRVEFLLADDGEDCVTALERALSEQTDGLGEFVRETGELRSPGRLFIDFAGGDAEDTCAPCHPDPTGRYLGAENQAIRIMLVDPSNFVWAYDNAAPLYRVTIAGAGDAPSTDPIVTMLTLPKDEEHWPLVDRVVEIVPWSAILENGEKVADEIGVFCRVSKSFQPDGDDAKTFRIDRTDTAAMQALNDLIHAWDNDHPRLGQLDPGSEPRHFYVRFWHQVSTGTGTPVLIPTSSGAPLGSTGLIPNFIVPGLRGDFWIAALRPETPDRTVPFDLHKNTAGVPPHGPRHFYAPLAMIHSANNVVTDFEDCRKHIIPVTDMGCCTVIVGDGIHSFGQYRSIQAALNALPPEGGKICVRPGIYPDPVVISQRSNIVIEGCREDSIIDGTVDAGDAMISIVNGSTNITIESLTVRTTRRPAFEVTAVTNVTLRKLNVESVLAGSAPTSPLIQFLFDDSIVFESSRVFASGRVGVFLHDTNRMRLNELDVQVENFFTSDPPVNQSAHSALEMSGLLLPESDILCDHIEITFCRFHIEGGSSEHALVVLAAIDSKFSDNFVRSSTPVAWGGVHLLSGTRSLEISRNLIEFGSGHGITLGSTRWTPDGGNTNIFVQRPILVGQNDFPAGFGHWTGNFRAGITEGVTFYQAAMENEGTDCVTDILIIDNQIRGMSGNGISNLTIFGAPGIGSSDDIPSVKNLHIARNRIQNCLQNVTDSINIQSSQAAQQFRVGGSKFGTLPGHELRIADLPFGGIVLGGSRGLEIVDNIIQDCVSFALNAVSKPICGIFVLGTTTATISGNRIINNGRLLTPTPVGQTPPVLDPGVRAGIAIPLAGVDIVGAQSVQGAFQTDFTSAGLLVKGNTVKQLEGRALFLVGVGPMTVQGNTFLGRGFHGSTERVDRYALGDVVFVQNIGAPVERDPQPTYAQLETDFGVAPPLLQDYLDPDPDPSITNMSIPGPPFFRGFSGAVGFDDNQVYLDWVVARHDPTAPSEDDPSVPLSYAPVALVSLDTVHAKNNRLGFRLDTSAITTVLASTPFHLGPVLGGGGGTDARLPPRYVLTHLLAVGATNDVSGNRVAESFANTDVSILSVAVLANIAVFNQTSHCVIAYEPTLFLGLQAGASSTAFVKETRFRVQDGNMVLFPAAGTSSGPESPCNDYHTAIQGLVMGYVNLLIDQPS